MTEPLMALADFIIRVPEAADNTDRAEAMLEDASALVRAAGDRSWTAASVPEEVAVITARAAARALFNPGGEQRERTLDQEVLHTSVYLTAEEQEIIQQAAGTLNALRSLATTRALDDVGDVPDAVPTFIDGRPELPWSALGKND